MGNVVVGNYPGSIPAPLAKRNCPATGTGSGLTHCFLFGQSRGQRTTTLSALSFFSGPHFSPRQSFPLSFAPFDESCCCGISGGWDLSQGFALGGPGEKGAGGDAKGSPSHQAGGSPRCRPTRSLMSPKLNQLPPLSHLTASLVGSHCTQIHPFDIFISTFGGFPLGITGRVGCAGATGLRSVASRPGGGLPAVGQQRTSTGAPLTARTPATARDNCHHNKGTPHWRDDHLWGSHFYTSSLQETYEMQECN